VEVRLPTNGTVANPRCQYRCGRVRRTNSLGPLVSGAGQTLLDRLELLFSMLKFKVPGRWLLIFIRELIVEIAQILLIRDKRKIG